MINLNTTDVNELVLKLSNALFNAFDNNDYYDIKHQTGCTDEEVAQIIEARKIAREIAFEEKFIPLDFNPKDGVQWLDNSVGDWNTNTGSIPCDVKTLVDVMFFGDTLIFTKHLAEHWRWSIHDKSENDIQFWRYSK